MKSVWMVGQEFLTGPWLGDPEEILVGKFWNGPWLGVSEGFWLENVKMKRSVKRMDMWLGGHKEDVPQSNRRARSWWMCEMGYR